MSDENDKFQTKVEVSLARIEERLLNTGTEISGVRKAVDAQFENFKREAEHRHTNIKMQLEGVEKRLDNYVPRREIETMDAATRAFAKTMADEAKAHCDTNRAAVIARVNVVEDGLKGIRDDSRWIKRAVITAAISAAIGLGAHVWNTVVVLKPVASIVGK